MNQPEKPLKQESLTTSSSASSTRVCSSCGLAWEMTTTTCPRDGTALTTPIETDPAFRNYEYIETCGEGGMGVVYKARQVILNKVIAIKMLHPRLLSAEAILRFQREGASASMLEHPNIIKVLDLGVCAAGPYMILEFLQGQTLSQLLSAHGPLSTERFLHIFIQVCDALEHAHSRGILHRDLKPSNIMLTRNFKNEEEIRIMDFGIAKFIGESSQESFVSKLTRTGEAIGSPAYMSPEQAQNNNLDVRSDLYSIGCVMYEALTGSPPFVKANALDTLMAHLSEQPLSMAQAVLNARKFDEGLETIVARLLQKDPDLRFQTMHELKQQLIAIRDGQGLGQFVYDQNASEKPQKRFLAIAAWALPTVALCCVLLFMVKALNPFKHEKSTPQPNVVAALGDPSSQFNTHRAMTDPIAVKVDNKETVFSIGAEGLTTDDDLMPLQRSQVAVKISLRKAAITGEGLKYIKNIPTLKILNLTGTAVDTLKHLQNMQSLEELDLDQTRINDEQLEPISNLHLQRLDLSYTNVSALDALKEMQSLQTVRLNYASHLNREGMEVLGQLNNLAHLYLNHTNITDKDLLLLASLPNIQEIQVYGCKNLTGDGVLALNKKLPVECLVRFDHWPEMATQSSKKESMRRKIAAGNGPFDNLQEAKRLYEDKRYQEAQPLFAQSLPALEKSVNPDWEQIYRGYQCLTESEHQLNRMDAAIAGAKKATAILETHPNVDPSELPNAYRTLAAMYDMAKRYQEGTQMNEKATKLYETTRPYFPPEASDEMRTHINQQWQLCRGVTLLNLYNDRCRALANKSRVQLIPLLDKGIQCYTADPLRVKADDTAEYRRQLGFLYLEEATHQSNQQEKMHKVEQGVDQLSQSRSILLALPRDHTILGQLLNVEAGLGIAAIMYKHYDDAETIFKHQLEIGDTNVKRQALQYLKTIALDQNHTAQAALYQSQLNKLAGK